MITQEILRKRTKDFTIEIIKFIRSASLTYEDRLITQQLLRSASSMAANYRAAGRSRSKAEFFSKICIVIEEADETSFRLEVIREAEIINSSQVSKLLNESNEFVKIFSSTRKKLKESLN